MDSGAARDCCFTHLVFLLSDQTPPCLARADTAPRRLKRRPEASSCRPRPLPDSSVTRLELTAKPQASGPPEHIHPR